MKDRIFWKVVAVAAVCGLFAVACGLFRGRQAPPLSFSSPASAAEPAAVPLARSGPAPAKPDLKIQSLGRCPEGGALSRVKVPGGWLVLFYEQTSSVNAPNVAALTFCPDPQHQWDDASPK